MRDSGCGSSQFCVFYLCIYLGRYLQEGKESKGRGCTLNCIINSIQIKLNSHSLTHHAVRESESESELILIEILWSCLSKIIVRIRHNSASAWASFVLFVLRFNQEVFNCVVYFNWQLTISSRIYFSYPLQPSHQQFIPLANPKPEANPVRFTPPSACGVI